MITENFASCATYTLIIVIRQTALGGFSLTLKKLWDSRETHLKRKNRQNWSWSISQAPKTLHPTTPIMQPGSIFYLDPPCLTKGHVFKLHVNFLTQAFCQKFEISDPKPSWWCHYDMVSPWHHQHNFPRLDKAPPESHRRRHRACFHRLPYWRVNWSSWVKLLELAL